MTYGGLKHLTRALLIGDNTLTRDEDEMIALLDYAYDRLLSEVDVLCLFTDDPSVHISRQGMGTLVLEKPKLPEHDYDTLQIDHELGFVVARFICSFVSREKMVYHEREAQRLARLYNQKVQTAIEGFGQYEYLEEHDQEDQVGKIKNPYA